MVGPLPQTAGLRREQSPSTVWLVGALQRASGQDGIWLTDSASGLASGAETDGNSFPKMPLRHFGPNAQRARNEKTPHGRCAKTLWLRGRVGARP